MHQVVLFCACYMLAQADNIDEIRFVPFDGMSNTHYSVDAEMHLLQISYQKGIARVLGEFPVRSAVSAWYCPRYETIFWLEPIAESSQGITLNRRVRGRNSRGCLTELFSGVVFRVWRGCCCVIIGCWRRERMGRP